MSTILDHEKSLWEKGDDIIAGVDEVGRGALAGPMVVGAVILRKGELDRVYNILTYNDVGAGNMKNEGEGEYLEIKDSKLLTPKKRERLSNFIINRCICYSTFCISPQEIDSQGISACTQKAFYQAVKMLSTPPEHILTDAFPIRSYPQTVQSNIVSGDRKSLTIAAASIVAKVYRDGLMCEMGKLPQYLNYGFDKHKGYGTSSHLEMIRKHGLSDQHRRSFIHF